MTIIIDLPADFEDQLHRRAKAEQRSVEAVVLEILASSLGPGEQHPTPEEVAATIQAAPRNPASIRRASGSLAEALRDGPQDPSFDLGEWNKQWAAVEAEMRAITRNNDIAEGRE